MEEDSLWCVTFGKEVLHWIAVVGGILGRCSLGIPLKQGPATAGPCRFMYRSGGIYP